MVRTKVDYVLACYRFLTDVIYCVPVSSCILNILPRAAVYAGVVILESYIHIGCHHTIAGYSDLSLFNCLNYCLFICKIISSVLALFAGQQERQIK